MKTSNVIIDVKGLTRYYGDLLAVDHVSFGVARGEIFGFLGPNGAGKTTTVRMLTGVIVPTDGTAQIEGHDVVRDVLAAREHMGIVPEQANVYMDLTVWQNLMLMGELHGVPRLTRMRHGSKLLHLFGLAERAKHKGRSLSKGLRQRLMLCMALVSRPAILFLDEPTTGLDVGSARLIRELVVRMNREQGTTIFLTTHNIEEADQLCHRVAIIDKGRIAAIDTAAALKEQFVSVRSVEVAFGDDERLGAEVLSALEGVSEVKTLARTFKLFTREPGRVAQEIASLARDRGVTIKSIRTCEPALEDVFTRITEDSSIEQAKADG